MKENIVRAAEKFINLEIIALAFLLPLFFLPVTTEFFEFNKLALLSVATILGLLAWGLKVAIKGNLGIRSSLFDIPVLFLWLITLISTIFSDNRLLSVVGQYARWHPSLFSVTILTVFYFLVSWNIDKKTLQRTFWALTASFAISLLLFIPQYFGVDFLKQTWSARPTFTPLGSPTALAIFVGAVSGLVLRWLVTAQKTPWKVVAAILLILAVAALAFINSPAGWVALGVSVIISFLTASSEFIGKSKMYLLGVFTISLVLAGTVLLPPIFDKTTFLNRELPKEISLDLRTSWSVAATSFRQKPAWGSGPSTFLSDFTRYKPLRFNQTSFWTLRFEKPLSEYLRTFAEEGLLGVLAWLVLLVALIRALLKDGEKQFLPVAAAVVVSLLITHATVLSSFLLFISLATVGTQKEEPAAGESREIRKWLFALLGVITLFAVLGLGWIYRAYAAEVAHRKSLTVQGGQEVYNLQTKASQDFQWRAEYHLSLARTSFVLANQLASVENPTEEDQENIKVLVAQSISEARRATELYPLNAGNWESLAQIYRSLVGLARDAESWSANSYQRAVALDLFNPLLRVSFGGLYYQLGEYEQAVDQFRAAVNLKPNYANAHYNLGRAYKELGKNDLAIQELESALQLTTPEAEGYQEAKQILNELKGQ
ncbi:tetratricopeptide repeat protein [Candidatus Saccharibacteria bacterium]|nr:tetratricopeptide repeat protein [Candidatus Saccharibacteria bacterium]